MRGSLHSSIPTMRYTSHPILLRALLGGFALALLAVSCGKKEEQPTKSEAAITSAASVASVSAPVEAATEKNAEEEEAFVPTEPPPLEIPGGLERDLGVIWEFGVKQLEIPLKNTSDKMWVLWQIDASCSCTSVDGIPGGREIPAHGEWIMDVKIDASRIKPGPFSREIVLVPQKYLPVRMKFKGTVKRFLRITPEERVLSFQRMRDPREKWELAGTIRGIEDAAGKLEIALVEKANSLFNVALQKTKPGEYKVTVSPKGVLPYGDSIGEAIRFKCLAPQGAPDFEMGVKGRVGMTMRFNPSSVALRSKDFDANGIARVTTMIGYDPVARKPRMNSKRVEKLVDNVDWQLFYDNCEFTAPEGVRVRKEFTKYGVRVHLEIPKASLPEKGRLHVQLSAFGHPLTKMSISKSKLK